MAQLANIVGIAGPSSFPDVHPHPGASDWLSGMERLIPGSNKRRKGIIRDTRRRWLESITSNGLIEPNGLLESNGFALAPETWFQIARDTALITAVYVAESQFRIGAVNWALLLLYMLAFFASANQMKLYAHGAQRFGDQIMLGKVLSATTLIAVLALKTASQNRSLLPLFVWSGMNWLVLGACRQPWRSFDVGQLGSRRKVLIIGDSFLGKSVADALRKEPRTSRIVQSFLLDSSLRQLSGAEMMKRIARQECVDEIIIATTDRVAARIAFREARRIQLDVSIVPDLPSEAAHGVESIYGIPMLKIAKQSFPVWPLALKRCADVIFSAAALLALSPLLLLIAIAVKLESAGPALYRASRVGRKAAPFHCYKFRTMVKKADEQKTGLRSRNQRTGAFFKIKDDPRITRLGRLLRRYSLDELPQLWNVLLGDMSLVGPRPHPVDDVERYSVQDLRRLDFVPGMTGLWQVTARKDPSFSRCVELDVEYIRNWSVLLDLNILCRTVRAVLQGSGA